ncbi:MAG: hypothetical protein JSV47_04055 [Deltaproteobacteria bacterium]|nr:MAG: hypothetical protein JSV47_04055 [Deltaproteobacteria bacterium]
MLTRKICVVFALALLLGVSQAMIGADSQAQSKKRSGYVITETLQVMGKGVDYIVIGEEPLYVAPEVTKITDRYGAAISLEKLRTPCLAEVTYARWMQGVEKLPVVINLKVKKVKWGATKKESQE